VAIHGFVRDIPLTPEHVSYSTLTEVENGLGLIRKQSIPMMIIWGGKDFCFDKVFYDEWRERFPDAETHYFPDGGHYILEDKKDEISSLLKEFFLSEGQALN
jgi:haloalkane dehalogenase